MARLGQHYGGRGITICDRWLHGEGGKSGFACFLADIGPRPSPKHELDRIDPNGNYEPGNVVWSTKANALLHTRRTRLIIMDDGRLVTEGQFAREVGINSGLVFHHANAFRKSLARIDLAAFQAGIIPQAWFENYLKAASAMRRVK